MSAKHNEEEKHKPTTKEQTSQTYVQVERGIYRYKEKSGEITYHERPEVGGKRTYRALGFGFTRQTNIGNARTELSRRRIEIAGGRNPYEEKRPESPKTEKPTVSKVIQIYIEANYLDRYLKPRIGRTLECETANCETLLEYWNGQVWDTLTPKSWDDYHEWRIKDLKKGCAGDSSVDKERITLSNAFNYAKRKEIVTANPAAGFSRHHPLSAVKHCREFQPKNAEELHEIAALFFESSKRYRWALGFQLLLEANTGLRTSYRVAHQASARLSGCPSPKV
jgi:hypothetical protein